MRINFYLFDLIAVLLVGIFMAVYNFLLPNPAVAAIKEHLDMNIKPYYVEFHEDTHGGFHGDGEEIIIFTPNPEQIEKIEAEWKKTPVETGIASLIFPGTEYNGLELRSYIPTSEGYWFYKNRGESAYAYNFSFALFDGEKVYYYELDT